MLTLNNQNKTHGITYIPSAQCDARVALIRGDNENHEGAVSSSPVLFLHGATVPTLMTSGYRMGNLSWMDSLADDARAVWGVDLVGYGESDPYPLMKEAANVNARDFGSAEMQVPDIDRAVDRILSETGVTSLHLVAISRGAIPAGYYAAAHPEKIRTLTLHGPITRQEGTGGKLLQMLFGSDKLPQISHFDLTAMRRFEMLRDDKPTDAVSQLDPDFVANWVMDYNRRVHGVCSAEAPPITTPMGFVVDIYDAWCGRYFDTSKITMPTLLIRGEWDEVLTPARSCQELFEVIAAKDKRYIQFSRATHSLLFETQRLQLYETVKQFLTEFD
jgi:pimeloyl-ACP methyl ester carboxylesterase